jgi:prevent-host-death family protein
MATVTIHQAKTNLSRLLQKVAAGEEVIIVREKQPVARLVAVGQVKGKRQPGSLKDTLRVTPEFLSLCPNKSCLAGSSLFCAFYWIPTLCRGGSLTIRPSIAQSQAENIPVITNEKAFDTYGVRRLW